MSKASGMSGKEEKTVELWQEASKNTVDEENTG